MEIMEKSLIEDGIFTIVPGADVDQTILDVLTTITEYTFCFNNTQIYTVTVQFRRIFGSLYYCCIVVNNFIETMDSIPTSCIQLAKEQIIKYSDPKYNINNLKTGDCETMLLNQTIYYLNKSKSKWISVGLYYRFEFASVVKIFGRSKQYVIFKEEEWIQFHEQRENINKYFQTFDTMWKPRQIGSKTLTFEMIKEKKNLKIEDMSGNEVYLGWESVSEVWSLESVLRYR
ncbi:hypothetical protein FQA39_LY08787 [Lamprigera yunnana]|nr:hypothetical protein FQA39_LY08787 [Lamprigera yunnana]